MNDLFVNSNNLVYFFLLPNIVGSANVLNYLIHKICMFFQFVVFKKPEVIKVINVTSSKTCYNFKKLAGSVLIIFERSICLQSFLKGKLWWKICLQIIFFKRKVTKTVSSKVPYLFWGCMKYYPSRHIRNFLGKHLFFLVEFYLV